SKGVVVYFLRQGRVDYEKVVVSYNIYFNNVEFVLYFYTYIRRFCWINCSFRIDRYINNHPYSKPTEIKASVTPGLVSGEVSERSRVFEYLSTKYISIVKY